MARELCDQVARELSYQAVGQLSDQVVAQSRQILYRYDHPAGDKEISGRGEWKEVAMMTLWMAMLMTLMMKIVNC